MNWENTALMIIDMQKSFTQNVPKEDLSQVIKNQKEIIHLCRQKNVPIFDIRWFGEGHTIADIKNELSGYPHLYEYIKDDDNAFQASDVKILLTLLDSLGIETLFLIGMNASACVLETADGAQKNEKNVVIHQFLIVDEEYGFLDDDRYAVYWYKKNTYFLNDMNFSNLF
ncbi:isochorismatase family protein [Candidatus Parcubacteria bacterium]|jgi:nicotinamidase-related amidase|nr:MAG: isochorismatase family protein [Candidatus Parcubacteria bacterium]